MTSHRNNTFDNAELASSIYPVIGSTILAGPDFSYNPLRTGSFRGPITQMFHPSPSPNLKLDTNIRFVSNFWYPSRETPATLDQYGDQHALTPVEEDGHYAEKLALTPIRESQCQLPRRRQKQSKAAKIYQSYDYVEELALSPVFEKRLKLPRRLQQKSEATKRVRRAGMTALVQCPTCKSPSQLPLHGRKQHQSNVDDVVGSITVETPGEGQEEGAVSREATNHVEHRRLEGLHLAKCGCVRKRKMNEEARPARKSVRSRNVISYTE